MKRAPAAGALVFFGSFLLYLMTAAPAVTFWDSGELIAAAYHLGIPHQPGYPLFCITGRLFTFIPIGNVASRINLMSAFFSSLTVLMVYHILLEILREQSFHPSPCNNTDYAVFPALSLAAVFAVVRSFWSEAVVAEVYALNALFVSTLVFLYLKASSGRLAVSRYISLSAFLFGLGVVNHMSLVLYLPALVMTWFLLPGERRGRALLTFAAFGFVLLGLSAYAYLPIRSLAGAEPNIGHPDTFANFWWTIKWGEYIRHAKDSLTSAEAIVEGVRLTDPKAAAAGLMAVFFSWRLLKSDWRLWLPLVVYLALYTLGISTQVLGGKDELRFGLAAKFFIPTYILIVVFIGASFKDLLCAHGGKWFAIAFAALIGLSAAVLLYRNYYPNNCSRNFMAFDYAENSLKSAGEKGVLFTWGDNGVFPLWYLQMVERYRDDAVLVHTPLMTYDWYLTDLNGKLGGKAVFLHPYYLGENVFRVLKAAGPPGSVAYDYSSKGFLKLDESRLKARGLVYFEGAVPAGDPWQWYVFRGVDDAKVYKGGMEKNIIAIYEYQKKVTGN